MRWSMLRTLKDSGLPSHLPLLRVRLRVTPCPLSESVGNDIRQVLHAMQMWSRSSNSMEYTEVGHQYRHGF
jgi:hypothetical protein